ncbi:cytochrome P450 [cf. Phormidesmis sp. LEGE 11477]|uniref:cytochrome P450 n=1 Tax=cf. Phormidesmis sp. LEGE 11477 TaxID=1828680 RepID=UPI00187FB48E|nr:cytochrome P450 [cf. Phormidesmis sp. LEGE 11477]MBE9064411.1 cytochrome P450 [cf. Phormidesmis sp. LEGE 11477]
MAISHTIPRSQTPKFLQTTRWMLDPAGYLHKKFDRHGDIFQAAIAWGRAECCLLSNPQAIQYLLTHDTGKELSAPGELNQIVEPLVGSKSVMLLSGSAHRNRRRLTMPPFHGEHLATYAQLIAQVTEGAITQWSPGDTINVRKTMQKITMRVILQVVFGLYEGDRYEQLEQLLGRRMDMTATPASSILIFLPWLTKDVGDWSPGGRLRQMTEKTDELLFAEIEERRANLDANLAPERLDILSLLLAARDEEGNQLSNRELRDELMTLLVAGHETTATALTWAMYWIHSRPEVKKKLVEELQTLNSSKDNSPKDIEQVLQLPYLSAVCDETLRIHPVAMLTFPRQVEKPVDIGLYHFEPGTILMGCIYLLHQREDLYPKPEQFRPERFLERQFSPYEFMPFGGGVRRCIGTALAKYEMKIALSTILSQADLSLANSHPVRPARRGITLSQNTSVQINVNSRL